jgi:hypothetical protein
MDRTYYSNIILGLDCDRMVYWTWSRMLFKSLPYFYLELEIVLN